METNTTPADTAETHTTEQTPDNSKQFKQICGKIGLIMTIFFASRAVALLVLGLIYKNVNFTSETVSYLAWLPINAIFLYFIPIIAASLILRNENKTTLSASYRRPKNLPKALGNFPALFGLGMGVNLIMQGAKWLIGKLSGSGGIDPDSFGTMETLVPPNIFCAVFLAFHMIIMAGVFEEILCRKQLLGAMRPYGNGFAIIISGLLFGIMHGNLIQSTYAFVVGIALGYIAIQTGSILVPTILHCMFNSISATMMVFMSTDTIAYTLDSTAAPANHEPNSAVLAAYGVFMAFFVLLMVAGLGLAIKRIGKIKAYARHTAADKATHLLPELTTKRKCVALLTTAPALIMLLLAVEAHLGSPLLEKLFEVLS